MSIKWALQILYESCYSISMTDIKDFYATFDNSGTATLEQSYWHEEEGKDEESIKSSRTPYWKVIQHTRKHHIQES